MAGPPEDEDDAGRRATDRGPRATRWWRRVPLRRQLLYAFAAPVAIAMLSSIYVADTLDGLRGGVVSTSETSEAVRLRYVLFNAVVDSESAFRGYLLTGDDAFLRPYTTAPRIFDDAMARLAVTEAGEPAHLQRLREAHAGYLGWRATFAEPLVALRLDAPPRVSEELRVLASTERSSMPAGDLAGALRVLAARFPPGSARGARLSRAAALVATSPEAAEAEVRAVAAEVAADGAKITEAFSSGRGKAMVDDVRWSVNAALEEEMAELADRHAADQVHAQNARLLVLVAPIVAVLIGLAVTWLLLFDARRGIEAVAKAASRVAAGDLERRARVLRDDEIGALAVAFNRMAAELADRRRRTDAIQRHQALLAGSDSAEELYQVAESVCRVLFPHASGAIYRLRASRTLAERVAAWSWPDESPLQLEPSDCRALRSGRPLFYDGTEEGVACAHTLAIGVPVRRSLCLPLAAQGEMLGILQLGQFGEGPRGPIAGRDHDTAQLVAEQLGMAIANLQLRETLRYQSTRDPLTGLHNRRYLEETLSRELERSLRAGRPLSLALLDVDHFKRFNDTHGHAAGDRALQSVAEVLKRGVRGSDVACRFGGEEFVLLFPDMPVDVAVARVDALRLELERRPAATRDAAQSLTFSAGVACAPMDGRDGEALLRSADAALYRAKSGGRNRVCSAVD
jgi:diguanylate cyclase (GGDEF)-like protein